MSGDGMGQGRSTGRWLLLASVALACWSTPSPAQPGTAPAALASPRRYSIPPGPLSGALLAFGETSGLRVIALTEMVAGRRSPGVSGSRTADAALRELLAETGLAIRTVEGGTVTLAVAAAPAAVRLDADVLELPEVAVNGVRRSGDPGTAFGPVPGYIARGSAVGTKTDTPLIETPQSVSVLSNEQLQAQKVQSVSEALRYAPGVRADSNGFNSRADDFTIRGFDVSRSGLFQDGLRLYALGNQAQPVIEPYGLERIDVLRGANSVLYGQSGPGGIVDLVSKRPQATPLHEIQLQSGSFGRVQGTIDLGGAVNEDGTLLYRFTGLARRSDTFEDFAKDNRVFLAPALTWQPTGDTTVTLLGQYQHDEIGTAYIALPRVGTLDRAPYGYLPRQQTPNDSSDYFGRTRVSVGSLIEHRFNDNLLVRQSLRYLQIDSSSQGTVYGAIQPDPQIANRYVARGGERAVNVSIDNQVEYRLDTGPFSHRLLGGVDAQVLRGRVGSIVSDAAPYDLRGVNPGLGPLLFRQNYYGRSSIDDFGFYAQDQIKLGSHLILTLSERYDLGSTRDADKVSAVSNAQTNRAFTGRAGLTYVTDIGLAPYVSYSESFLPQAGATFSGTPFRPSTGTQYEAGIKYQPAGFQSYITLAGFQLTQQNVLTTDPRNPDFSVETGEIRSRGVEVEVKANIAKGLNVIASASHVNPIVTKSNDTPIGKRPTDAVRDLASLWVDQSFEDGRLRGLRVAAGVRYVGPNFGDDANTERVPGYKLFDAALRYRLGELSNKLEGWNLSVNATNIANTRYIIICSVCRYGYPRAVLGTVSYRW